MNSKARCMTRYQVWWFNTLGAIHKLPRDVGGEGGQPIVYFRGRGFRGFFIAKELRLSTWEEEGQNFQKRDYVVCEWPLAIFKLYQTIHTLLKYSYFSVLNQKIRTPDEQVLVLKRCMQKCMSSWDWQYDSFQMKSETPIWKRQFLSC